MNMCDPIADMLTRLRNGIMARQSEVEMPTSKLKANIAEVLLSEGFINGYQVAPDAKQGVLRIQLKYKANKSVIDGLKRVSKPSCRVYVGHDEIPKVLSGLGVNILSTPRGVMSDKLARRKKVGGEILCAVW
ncbi:30S ribosomal protein S8 [Desulfocarbo indianensis]|nr:30S ribosomal protein S8 [Desulfocarbo indianensis]